MDVFHTPYQKASRAPLPLDVGVGDTKVLPGAGPGEACTGLWMQNQHQGVMDVRSRLTHPRCLATVMKGPEWRTTTGERRRKCGRAFKGTVEVGARRPQRAICNLAGRR